LAVPIYADIFGNLRSSFSLGLGAYVELIGQLTFNASVPTKERSVFSQIGHGKIHTNVAYCPPKIKRRMQTTEIVSTVYDITVAICRCIFSESPNGDNENFSAAFQFSIVI
jgi:hypothetical protein